MMTINSPKNTRLAQLSKAATTSVLSALALSIAMLSGNAVAQTIAIMNGDVHTITGSVIEDGDIIIQNGRITQIGSNLAAPDGAQVINADGRIVTPGLIAPHSSIGLVEIGAVSDSNDSSPNRDFELGAALNAADGYNPASTLIPINRAGGITRAVGVPSVGGSLFGGRAILIDMTGGPNSIMREDVAQSLLLDSGAASREGGTRMGAWAIAREVLDEAQLYANDPTGYRRLASDGRYKVTDLAALQPVLAGRVPLFVSVNRAADIRNVIGFKNDYGLKLIIVGGAEAWREARALAAADIPVIVDSLANLPGDFESLSSTLKNAALLNQAGVEISFYNPPGFGAHNLRLLTQLAGNAVADGLPFDAALAALTLYPARMFGIAGELGTIEVGKRADIVIWDGDPLELSTHVVTVLIDGQVQDLRNRQQMLSERYRTLDRGVRPHAYRGGN